MLIAATSVDWKRIADWAAAVVAGDAEPIAAEFARAGGAAPELMWDPPLDSLPEGPLRALAAHWNSLRGNLGVLPHLRQIDPVYLRPALGYVVLLDAIDGGRDFRYRLFGSAIAGVSGFDMTGRLASELPVSPHVAEFVVALHRAVVARRAPLYAARWPIGALKTVSWQRIALPLVDDDNAVVRLVGGVTPVAYAGRLIWTPL